ncbi:MAG: AEC family transporter [Bacteroidales bacterium]
MNTDQNLIEGVVVMLAMISLIVWLKKMGVFKSEDSELFSRLVMHITLPALIFSSLAVKVFNDQYIKMAGIMALIEIAMISLAWFLANLFKIQRSEKGALMLVSAFGMTTMLGYPIIQQMFPNNAMAMEEAVITSEFGVGLLLFILGPLIAMHFGENIVQGRVIAKSVEKFFVSPIFISFIAGIGFSFIPIDHSNPAFNTFIHFFDFIGNANLFLVAITIGLIVEFKHVKKTYWFLGIAVILKLFLKPMLSVWLTNDPHFTQMMREIVVVETALPSAILTAVFAKHYNCRPDLVSLTIMVTLILSVLSMGVIFNLAF